MTKISILTISIASILILGGSIGVQQSFGTHASPVITGWSVDGNSTQTVFEIGTVNFPIMHCDLNNTMVSNATVGVGKDDDDLGLILDSYSQENLPNGTTVIQQVDITPFYNGNPDFTKYVPGSWDAKCIASSTSPSFHVHGAAHIDFDIVDTTGPTVTAQIVPDYNTDLGEATAIIFPSDINNPTITDADPRPGVVNFTRSDGLDLNDPYPIGNTTITVTAYDATGNSGQDTTDVTVIDNEPPTITAQDDINVNTDPGLPTAVVAAILINDPTTSDNDAVDSVTITRSDNQTLSDPYPIGVTTITLRAEDPSGNFAEDTLIVTVTDIEPPIITVNFDASDPYEAQSPNVYVDAGAIATDNSGNVTLTDNSGEIITENPGNYTVTYTAEDPSGNTAMANRTVTIVDTTAPVLTTSGDDRAEADENGQQSFSVTVTATDLPRDTLPQVTCTDESAGTVIDEIGGGTNPTTGPYAKGVETINCMADDGSPDSLNDTGSFDLAVAEIDITGICIAGISTNYEIICSEVTPGGDGGDTVTIDAKWGQASFIFSEGFFGDSDLNFGPEDVDSILVNGTVWGYNTTSPANMTLTWGAVDGNEPSLTPEQLNLNGNPDDGAYFEVYHSYSMAASDNIEQISAILEGSIVATSNLNVQVNVTKRATATDLVLSDTNVLWDHTLAGNNVTVVDIDAVPPIGIADLTVNFGSPGVAAGQNATTSDGSGSDPQGSKIVDLQAGTATAALNGPTYNVTSTFAGDTFYLASTDEEELTLDPHTTTTTTIVSEETVKWDHVFHATTTIVDEDAILAGPINSDTGSLLGVKTFTYSGLGVAGEDEQSHNSTNSIMSNGTHSTATTGEITLQAGNYTNADGITPQDVVATFAGSAAYLGSADQTDSIILDKHVTETSLDPLVDLVGGTSYTPSGLVTDIDRILYGNQTMINLLGDNFVSYDTGTLAGENVTLSGEGLNGTSVDVIMQGITITDENGSFVNNAQGVTVANLTAGAVITLPQGSIGVTLDIRSLDIDQSALFEATPSDGTGPFNVTVFGVDQSTPVVPDASPTLPDYVSALFAEVDAIDSLRLVSITENISINPSTGETEGDPGTSIEISEIRVEDPFGDPPLFLTINFAAIEEEAPEALDAFDAQGFATFVDGSFHDIITTPLGEAESLDVTATFDPTDQYLGSSDTQTFDTTFASWGFGSGIGGEVDLAADSGTGFVSVACGTDDDGDSICNANEAYGAQYSTGTQTLTYNYPEGDGPAGQALRWDKNDIFLEIDYMTGHKPNDLALTDIVTAFASSGVGNPNGVASGINIHYVVDDEIDHVAALNVWRDLDDDPTNDFNSIKSQYFGTIAERTVVNGTKVATLDDNNDGTEHNLVISGLKMWTPNGLTSVGGKLILTEKIDFASDVDVTLPTRIFWTATPGQESKMVFQQTGATFVIEDDFPDTTKKTITATIPYYLLNGATVPLSNWDIGSISIPYTTSAAVSAELTTAEEVPRVTNTLTDTKAQMTHYVLFAHSIGDCGPSGIAEVNGNDIIVSLGCNFGFGVEAGQPNPDVNGNVPTVGSRLDQAGTLMHELGHNLGLGHGGPLKISGASVPDANTNCKPNYQSVMSYSRQTPYYIGNSINEPFPLDYSHGTSDSINEATLSEADGFDTNDVNGNIVYGTPGFGNGYKRASVFLGTLNNVAIDMNGNGTTNDNAFVGSPFDVNNFGFDGCDASTSDPEYFDRDDWSNIVFDFRGPGGSAFDGFKVDPRKTAEITTAMKDQIIEGGSYWTGLFDPVPKDGSGIFQIGSTIPFKFEAYTCKPLGLPGQEESGDENCKDVDGLLVDPYLGEIGPDDIILESFVDEKFALDNGFTMEEQERLVRHYTVLATKVLGPAAEGAKAVILNEEESDVGYFKYSNGQFIFTWDTKQLLDPNTKGQDKKDNKSENAGKYSIQIVVEEEENRFLVDKNFDPTFRHVVPNESIVPEIAGFETTILVELTN